MNNKLYFEINGAIKGDTIVFIHGDALDHRQWSDQVVYFAHKYRVITYDLRGYGQSSFPVIPVDHPADLKGLLDSLGIGKAHLVGSSFGGEQAIDFTLLYPDKAESLTLVDSSLSGYKSTVNWETGALEDGLEIAKQRRLEHEVFKQTRKYPEAFALVKQMITDYSGFYWINKNMVRRMKVGAYKKLNKISDPTLVLVGEYDLDYFKAITQIIKEGITKSTFYKMQNAGHLPNLEIPEKFNNKLYDWLLTIKE